MSTRMVLVISRNNNAGVAMDIDSNHDSHTLPAHTRQYTREKFPAEEKRQSIAKIEPS